MKHLTINPKEEGTTIKFGKLPIFTRSLGHWSDVDEVVQLKVEGRYYAIELYPHQPVPLEEMLEKKRTAGVHLSTSVEPPQDDETAEECKADVEEANEPTPARRTQFQVGRERFEKLKELSRTGELAECKTRKDICKKMGLDARRNTPGYNWVSKQVRKGFLSEELVNHDRQNAGIYHYRMTGVEPTYKGAKNIKEKTVEKKAEKLTNELERLGFTNLSENPTATPSQNDPRTWLKVQDYIIYKLFIYGNGQASMDKAVSFDEVKELFTWDPKKRAGRIANVALIHLVQRGILEKAQPDVCNSENIFSLTVAKGGQYARYVYNVVSNGSYKS